MTRPHKILGWILLPLMLAGLLEAAETYQVDTNHSYVGFTVKHMAVASVRGGFEEFEAELIVDEEAVANSSIVFRIDAASVDTGNEDRDNHLRSADFLEVETYPEIVFESKKIEKAANGGYRSTGDLKIKETTREVALDLEINGPIQDPWGNLRIGAEGMVTIDRKDWGVQFDRIMDNGGLVVANDVKIEFALEAMRKPE